MVSFITTPPPFALAGQPAWFSIQAGSRASFVIAKVYDTDLNLLGTEKAFVDENHRARFELSQYMFDNIHPSTPIAPASAVQLNNTIAPAFNIRFFEDEQTQYNDYTLRALKGVLHDDVKKTIAYGISYLSFYAWLTATNSFLTFRPDTSYVYSKSQVEKLFWCVTDPDNSDLDVVLTITNDQGNESTHVVDSISGLEPGDVIEINCGYNSLGIDDLLDEGTSLLEYTIHVQRAAAFMSRKMKFVYQPEFRQHNTFVFLNPAGAFDTFTATGEAETSMDYNPETVSLLPAPGQDQATIKRTAYNITDQETVYTGFLSKQQIKWIPQLAYSEQPYWILNNNLVPVIFAQSKVMRSRSKSDYLFATLAFFANMTLITESDEELPTIEATLVVTDATCWESATGSIEFTSVSGASGNYQYSIDNGATWQASPLFENLMPSETLTASEQYYPVVKDANDSRVRTSFGLTSIDHPPQILAQVQVTDTPSTVSEGVIEFGYLDPTPDPYGENTFGPVIGGSGTFEYSINGGSTWQSSAIFENLAAGTYNCQVRDQANPTCVITVNAAAEIQSVVIVDPLHASVGHTDLACSEANTGTITISNPTGGSGEGYQYSIDDGTTWSTNTEYTGLAAAAYVVKMKDSTGTIATITSFSLTAISSIPAAPTGLNSELMDDYLVLSFTNNATNDDGTIIERRPAGASDPWSAYYYETPGIETVYMPFNDPDTWGITYEFRVFQYNGCGTSDASNTTTRFVPGKVPSAPVINTIYQSNESGNPSNCGGVRVGVSPVEHATWYEYRRNSDNNPVAVRFGEISRVTHAFDGAIKDHYTDTHALTYQVRACNQFGCSPWSTEAFVALTCATGTEYDPANF